MINKSLIDDTLSLITGFFGKKLFSVVLFGSYAEGKEGEYSDIDMLIITDEIYRDWREKRRKEVLLRKEASATVPVSPKIMTEKELNSAINNCNPFILNVMVSGRALYDSGVFAAAKERFGHIEGKKAARTPEGYWEVAL